MVEASNIVTDNLDARVGDDFADSGKAALLKRLSGEQLVVLDGAIGSELQRRGVPMNDNAWCGMANVSHADDVLSVHEDYIRAGCDIITTNTFATARHVLELTTLKDRVREVNEQAVSLAKDARQKHPDRDILIAGSMSCMPGMGSTTLPSDERAFENYQEQAQILASSGVDLILCEELVTVENARVVLRAAKTTGLPVFAGFSAQMTKGGTLVNKSLGALTEGCDGKPLDELVIDAMAVGGDAAGIMHTTVEAVAPSLEALRTVWGGPTYCYPESGMSKYPNWDFEHTIGPDEFAAHADAWIRAGARMLGGCCGTGPEHISALVHEIARLNRDSPSS